MTGLAGQTDDRMGKPDVDGQSGMSEAVWISLASGVIAAAVAGLVSVIVTRMTVNRAGRQKIAEARMEWNARHRVLSVELRSVLDRLGPMPKNQLRADVERAAEIATEILLIINPGEQDEAAWAEQTLQQAILAELTSVGVSVDMTYIGHHRAVLKHAWRTAKSEF